MNRPRLSLGLESTRTTLNLDVCARLGRELAEAREAQALTVRDVAARLLLSPAQVLGLERTTSDAFYSADFYASALSKYAALLGRPVAPTDEVLVRPEAAAERAASGGPVPPVPGRPDLIRAAVAPLIATTAIVACVLVGWWLVSHGVTGDDGDPAPVPEAPPSLSHLIWNTMPYTPVAVTLVQPARSLSATARPAPTAPSRLVTAEPASTDSGGFGHVRVARRTWVFVRYQDNSTIERVLAPGDRFVFGDVPIYLAVGAAPGAEVVIVGRVIDTEAFNVDGQLRIGSAFLSAAVRH